MQIFTNVSNLKGTIMECLKLDLAKCSSLSVKESTQTISIGLYTIMRFSKTFISSNIQLLNIKIYLTQGIVFSSQRNRKIMMG